MCPSRCSCSDVKETSSVPCLRSVRRWSGSSSGGVTTTKKPTCTSTLPARTSIPLRSASWRYFGLPACCKDPCDSMRQGRCVVSLHPTAVGASPRSHRHPVLRPGPGAGYHRPLEAHPLESALEVCPTPSVRPSVPLQRPAEAFLQAEAGLETEIARGRRRPQLGQHLAAAVSSSLPEPQSRGGLFPLRPHPEQPVYFSRSQMALGVMENRELPSKARFSSANSHRCLKPTLRRATTQESALMMATQLATVKSERQRCQCGRSFGKGQANCERIDRVVECRRQMTYSYRRPSKASFYLLTTRNFLLKEA